VDKTVNQVGVSSLNVHGVIDLSASNSLVVKVSLHTQALFRTFMVACSVHDLLNAEP
jgi:hypothetical protein